MVDIIEEIASQLSDPQLWLNPMPYAMLGAYAFGWLMRHLASQKEQQQ